MAQPVHNLLTQFLQQTGLKPSSDFFKQFREEILAQPPPLRENFLREAVRNTKQILSGAGGAPQSKKPKRAVLTSGPPSKKPKRATLTSGPPSASGNKRFEDTKTLAFDLPEGEERRIGDDIDQIDADPEFQRILAENKRRQEEGLREREGRAPGARPRELGGGQQGEHSARLEREIAEEEAGRNTSKKKIRKKRVKRGERVGKGNKQMPCQVECRGGERGGRYVLKKGKGGKKDRRVYI